MKRLFVIALLLNPQWSLADPVEEAATKAYLANINTLLVFTSESGLNSGYYHFTEAGFNMKSYTLPLSYHFKSENDNVNWFISGGMGYSITRLTSKLKIPKNNTDITLHHDNKLQTYAAGVGGGLRYTDPWGIGWSAGYGFIYTRVHTSIKPNDDIGEAIKDFFDGEYNDNLSLKFSIAGEYEKQFYDFRTYAGLRNSNFNTKSDFTLNALTSINSSSNLTSLVIGGETPALLHYNNNNLSLESYFKANYLHGDIVDVVQFKTYMNIGAVAYWNTPNMPFLIRRFYTELSTVLADGLEGYNIGIGISFDY